MDIIQLLINLHKNTERQGPGCNAITEKALNLAIIDPNIPLKIADIGCGTGAASLLLAQHLNAQITAVDLAQEFLDILEKKAKAAGLSNKIATLNCSMDTLPFQDDDFDVIWSEGAIYNIGFEKGVKEWKRFLKVGGILVASEITWLTDSRPREIQKYWESHYPEIDLASSKIHVLEKNGYSPIGYFVLPESCWLEHYYRPLESLFQNFLAKYEDNEEASNIVEEHIQEIALYEKYRDQYSYGMYLAKKL